MATATTSSATSTPALPPPPGAMSNFDHPATLKGAMDLAIGVAIPLTTICFLLRVYVRAWIKRKWICEDCKHILARDAQPLREQDTSMDAKLTSRTGLALIAWIGTVTYCVTGAVTIAHHGGKHGWDMTKDQAKEAYYWLYIARIHYGVTICIAKLAVLCLYRRVFSIYPRSTFDVTVLVLIVLLVLFYAATVIAKIWECVPRARAWDQFIPGNCIDTPMLLDVSGVFNTLTDFIMVMMPLRVVWSLNMKVTKKAHVVLAFTFGMCLVGSVVRLQSHKNPDKTWVQTQIIMWAVAELTTGILCVSFPELGVLFRGGMRRPSTEASTGIREGRYRSQDAAFSGVQHRLWTWTTSLRSSLAAVNGAGTTTMTSAKEDSGGGGQHEHIELAEVILIDRPATAVIVESGRLVHQTLGRSPGDVEVTGEIDVD